MKTKGNKQKTEYNCIQLLNVIPFACMLVSKDLKIIDINDETLNLFKVKDKQGFGGNFFDFSPEYQSDGQRSEQSAAGHLSKALTDGKCVFSWLYNSSDGALIPSEVTFVRVAYENEVIIAAYIRDLREHFRMLSEIKQRDNLLRAVNDAAVTLLSYEEKLFENTLHKGIGYIAGKMNVDRVYIWKNEIIDGIQHYVNSYEWLKDNDAHGLIAHPESKYSYDLMPRWKINLHSGECINGPILNLPPEEYDLLKPYNIKSVLVIPLHLQGGLWGFISFDDCKTERIFNEDEISILRSAGLMLVHAITRNEMMSEIQKTSSRLKEALTAAQDASNAKSSFLATMSHEIRTPMNAIIGMTRIGKSSSDMEKMVYAFDKIDGASNHLLGVINDILDISKIESGKFELSYEEFNFENMIKTVINVIRFRAEEKRQKLTVFIDKNIPKNLIGDDQRLSQIITNLLSNAVKFTPSEKPIRLDAFLVEEKDRLCTLKISVKDAGIGISAQQQSKLFSAFQQAESSTSKKFGGTGLGLAISKHIVDCMNGEIWIESELGKGATFTFTIKAERGSEQAVSPLISNLDLRNIRLLIVSEDMETLECFTSITERLGLKCDSALDAAAALTHIDNNGFYDICFIDWDMTDISGDELSRQIMALSIKKSAIVMVSAYDRIYIEQTAKAEHIKAFLPKPLFESTIADCVNKCLAKPSVSDIADPSDTEAVYKGRHLLLVEDIEINREIILSMLESTLIIIDCAENGAEAVRLFEKNFYRYDIIFMDIQMPEMDGYEATRRIRALDYKKAKEIPIIAMTANVFREDIEKCLKSGMTGHLGKPLDVDKVFKVLEENL